MPSHLLRDNRIYHKLSENRFTLATGKNLAQKGGGFKFHLLLHSKLEVMVGGVKKKKRYVYGERNFKSQTKEVEIKKLGVLRYSENGLSSLKTTN